MVANGVENLHKVANIIVSTCSYRFSGSRSVNGLLAVLTDASKSNTELIDLSRLQVGSSNLQKSSQEFAVLELVLSLK